jgi:hypothetical protein
MMDEFIKFSSIQRFIQPVVITHKLHGSNGQIYIKDDGTVMAGSRNRWLTIEDDNYGFAKFVKDREKEILEKLTPGRHYGEVWGVGINSGEGGKTKRFALFNTNQWEGKPLPEGIDTVPVLYKGPYYEGVVEETMAKLKAEGSRLVPGFMKVEGVVIYFERSGLRMKHVFENESTAWRGAPKTKEAACPNPYSMDVSHLLQPIRLEKLLSRDESYTRDYPKSLPALASAYVADLIAEGEITGDEDTINATKKALGRNLFGFLKASVKV